MKNWSETKLVAVITLVAMAIRVYLSLTSFCIAADGVGYLEMAQAFTAGHPAQALSSLFSPLYPFLISLGYRILPNWELTGELISTVFGTLSIPLLYLLIREVHGRRELAAGAAALAAIHPELANYSASVRTEAGFICLAIASLYLFVSGVGRPRPLRIAGAGAVGGVAYLCRAEGIGLIPVCIAILFIGTFTWRRWNLAAAVRWAIFFAVPFAIVASPYLIYLRHAMGHWTVSRELNFAAAQSVMERARNKTPWLSLQRSANTSILAPLLTDPRAYFSKLGYDLLMSPYYFMQAILPPVAGLLVIGLWVRGRGLFLSFGESVLALEVGFHFFGFAFYNTGPRFMVHLIPYTFGWTMIGLEAATRAVERLRLGRRRIPAPTLAVLLALVLLPRTLWPIGYDLRGFRYAAAEIARRGVKPGTIACGDPRFAFYADADRVELPEHPRPDVCGWVLSTRADYMMLSEHDESRWGDLSAARCLEFIRRYPRTGARYFDLFQIRRRDPNGGVRSD
ncbi:MAG: glycosyltransferase family 39 protein [Candidatus Binataceae bacterium]